MMDDLQKAYSAYQQALYHLRDPKVDHSNMNSPDKLKNLLIYALLGTETLVWHWHIIR